MTSPPRRRTAGNDWSPLNKPPAKTDSSPSFFGANDTENVVTFSAPPAGITAGSAASVDGYGGRAYRTAQVFMVVLNLAVFIMDLVVGLNTNAYRAPVTALRPTVDTATHQPSAPSQLLLGTLPVLVVSGVAACVNAIAHFVYVYFPEYISLHRQARYNEFRFLHLALSGSPLLLSVVALVGMTDAWMATFVTTLWVSSCAFDLFIEVYLATKEAPEFQPGYSAAEKALSLVNNVRTIYYRLRPAEWALYGVTRIPILTIIAFVVTNISLSLRADAALEWWFSTGAIGFVFFAVVMQVSTLLRILHVGYWTSYVYENMVASFVNTLLCVFFGLAVFIGTAADT